MSSVKTSLFAALLAAAVTVACFYFPRQRHMQEAARLRSENNRMRFAASQQKSAPTPKAAATPAVVPSGNAGDSPSAPAPAPALPAVPAGDYRNEGQATPAATLQTFAWACDRADTEMVGRMIQFDDAARTKAAAFMASLPADARPPGNTLDEMAAAMLTNSALQAPFPNTRILALATVEPVSNDRVVLHLPGTLRARTEYQRVGDAWKYVITEAMVDDYLRRASQSAAGR